MLWILKPLLNSLQFPFYFVFAFFFVCKPGGILASQPGIQPVSPYPLHRKAKSQPLNFQESPGLVYALQIVGGDMQSPALWTPFTHIPGRLRVHPLCGSDPGSHDPMPFSLSAPWAALVCDLLSAFACLSGPWRFWRRADGVRVECPCIRVRVAGVVGRVLKPTEVQRPSAREVAKRLHPHRRWCDLDRPAKVAFLRSSSSEGLSAFGYCPLWKKPLLCVPRFRNWTHCPLSVFPLRHLKVIFAWEVCLSSPVYLCVYSVIYFCQYGVNRSFNLWFRIEYCINFLQLGLGNNLELPHFYLYIYYIYMYLYIY